MPRRIPCSRHTPGRHDHVTGDSASMTWTAGSLAGDPGRLPSAAHARRWQSHEGNRDANPPPMQYRFAGVPQRGG